MLPNPVAKILVLGTHQQKSAHPVKVILHPWTVDVELVIPNAGPDADFRDNKVGPLKVKRLDDTLIGVVYVLEI